MMLLRSLICIQGYDRGWRHLAIVTAVYVLLLLIRLLFGSGYLLWLPGVLLVPLLLCTSWRRVRDAGRPGMMCIVALLPWLLVMVAMVMEGELGYLQFGLGLALLLHFGLALLPVLKGRGADSRRSYIQGYCGPVDLSPKIDATRVEPTLGEQSAPEPARAFFAETSAVDGNVTLDATSTTQTSATDEGPNWGNEPDARWWNEAQAGSFSAMLQRWQLKLAPLWPWLSHHRKAVAIAAGVLLLVLLVVVLWWSLPTTETETSQPTSVAAPENTAPVAREVVQLPDHFNLALQGDKLYVTWLGDTLTPGTIWELASASGDKRCAELQFNDGSRYRPMQVNIVGSNGQVEAAFSPLDTKAVINDVALRGSIKLCGYDFSLKGSQAALQGSEAFSRYLN